MSDIGERYGECLLNLPPIMRACAGCEKLYECEHGKKVAFGDMSITDKVLKLNWVITDSKEFETMTLEELIDYNKAVKIHDERQRMRESNILNNRQGLTAGAYDKERKKWVTDVLSGTDTVGDYVNVESSRSENKGLTAGYWDPEKKRWVAKK